MTDTALHPFGPTRRARRFSTPVAALAVVALGLGGLTGCGDDTDDTASDGASSSPSASPSESTPSTSASASASESASASPSSEAPSVPEIDPLVVKAVKDALKDNFPALVPTVLPAGWTVDEASYSQPERAWEVLLHDAAGGEVELSHQEAEVADLVAAAVGASAAKTGEVDLSSSGLGKWTVYDAAGTIGIARKLPGGTSAVITASDAQTAAELGATLIAAEDSNMPEAG